MTVNDFEKYFDPPVPVVVPEKPIAPTRPEAYAGFKFDSTKTGATTDAVNQISLSGYGGWGQLTMGLIKPAVLQSHSFGMFGSGLSTATYDAGA